MDKIPQHLLIVTVAAIALGLRLHQIESPAHVCWDEVHFGKYASYYINRTLFFDVHPPLGKMILALSGYMTGYDGKYAFNKPADSLEDVNYVGMRQISAVFGAAVVPLSAAIVWELSSSITAAFLASVLVMSDTALTSISRFILLDSILLFFVFLSCYFYIKYAKAKDFESSWWLYLCGCGSSLACALGVKFVGLFVIGHIGVCVVGELWTKLQQKEIPLETVVQHILARVYTLICLPLFVYSLIYVVHFVTLCRSGSGDGFYSSAFQTTLSGNSLYHAYMPQYIAYGSEITLKNYRTGGGYLHSHSHMYPKESSPSIQQVTSYSHRDVNNHWRIRPADKSLNSDADSVTFVEDGDLIRLEHVRTGRMLYSHERAAPLTKTHKQIGAYTSQNENPPGKNVFKIKVTSGHQEQDRITPIYSVVQLVHAEQNCVLECKGKQLPVWASEQIEVTCNPDLSVTSNSQWNVEEVNDNRLSAVRLDWKYSSPGFLSKLWEAHMVMISNNRNLKPKADTDFVSRPWMWPLAYRGQLLSVNPHILMLGNPATHWLILLLLCPTLVVFIFDMVTHQRSLAYSAQLGVEALNLRKKYRNLGFLALGYALHYLPFYPMTRVLYPHHYLPAYVYSAMFTGMSVDMMLSRLSAGSVAGAAVRWISLATIVVLSVISFYIFSPLVYGYDREGEDNPLAWYQWNKYWDF